MGGTVNWDIADFLVFGALLAGVAGCFWLVVRRTDNIAYRTGVGIALAAAFILIWVSGAVGIIGAPGNDANLMYVGLCPGAGRCDSAGGRSGFVRAGLAVGYPGHYRISYGAVAGLGVAIS